MTAVGTSIIPTTPTPREIDFTLLPLPGLDRWRMYSKVHHSGVIQEISTLLGILGTIRQIGVHNHVIIIGSLEVRSRATREIIDHNHHPLG